MPLSELLGVGVGVIAIGVTVWIARRAGQFDRPKIVAAMVFEGEKGDKRSKTFLSIEDLGATRYEAAVPFSVANAGNGPLRGVWVQASIPLRRGCEPCLRALLVGDYWSKYKMRPTDEAIVIEYRIGEIAPGAGCILAFLLDYTGDELRASSTDPNHPIEDELNFRVISSNHDPKEYHFKVCAQVSVFGGNQNWYDYVVANKGEALIRHPAFSVFSEGKDALAVDVIYETNNWGARRHVSGGHH